MIEVVVEKEVPKLRMFWQESLPAYCRLIAMQSGRASLPFPETSNHFEEFALSKSELETFRSDPPREFPVIFERDGTSLFGEVICNGIYRNFCAAGAERNSEVAAYFEKFRFLALNVVEEDSGRRWLESLNFSV